MEAPLCRRTAWRAPIALGLLLFWLSGCVSDRPGLASFRRAVQTERQGEWESAVAAYREALKADSRFPAAHIQLQDLMLQIGDPEGLMRYKLSESGRSWDEALALRIGRPDGRRADEILTLVAKAPGDPIVRFVAGEALLQVDRPDEAAIHLGMAWQFDPTFYRAAGELGWAYLQTQRYAEAEEILEEVARVAESDPLAVSQELRGLALLILGDKRAADFLTLAQSREPSPRATLLLTLAEVLRGNPVRAFEVLDVGYYEVRPDEDLYIYIANQALSELARAGQFGQGRRLAKQALTRFPHSARILHYQGEMLRAEGDMAAAEHTLLEAVKYSPYDPTLTRAARRQLMASGKYERAWEVWVRGLPQSLFAEGSRWRAIAQATATAKGRRPEALIALSRAYEQAGFWWEARVVLQHLIQGVQQRSVEVDPASAAELEASSFRLNRNLDMLDRIKQYADAHYQRMERGEATSDFAEVLADLENLCRQHGQGFAGSGGQAAELLLYGAELSPLATPDAPLVRFFEDRGLYFDIQTTRLGVEIRVMTLIAEETTWVDIDETPRGLRGVFCGEGQVRGFAGHKTGLSRVAGCATFSGTGYYVDLEAIRGSASEVFGQERTEVANPQGLGFDLGLWNAWIERFKQDVGPPLPGTDPDDHWVSEFIRLDMEGVRAHELGHLVDFLHLTPFWDHFWRNFWISLREGFSEENLATRFELVAESYALSQLEIPWPTLAINLRWLKSEEQEGFTRWILQRGRSVEEAPYKAVARQLFEHFLTERQLNDEGPLTPLARISREFVRESSRRLFEASW